VQYSIFHIFFARFSTLWKKCIIAHETTAHLIKLHRTDDSELIKLACGTQVWRHAQLITYLSLITRWRHQSLRDCSNVMTHHVSHAVGARQRFADFLQIQSTVHTRSADCMTELIDWARFNVPPNTLYVISGTTEKLHETGRRSELWMPVALKSSIYATLMIC